MGRPANNGSENTIYAFNDDLTWIKGKHTFKLGGMYQRNHYNGFGRQCIAGCATFTSKDDWFPGRPELHDRRRESIRILPAWLGG